MADITNPFDLLGESDENAEPNIEALASKAASAKKTAAAKEEPAAGMIYPCMSSAAI